VPHLARFARGLMGAASKLRQPVAA
jgi:hypothetical protein